MIIKKVAFGNWEEAFVETRLQDQVNVIFSDDNNRGKNSISSIANVRVGK